MPNFQDVRRELKAVRNEAGITVARLADLMDIHPTQISRYENDHKPNLDHIFATEVALGLPTGTVLSRAGYIDGVTVVRAV